MSLAIHPYISGLPHRIKYLDAIYEHVGRFEGVVHWNGAEILDWYLSQASVRMSRMSQGVGSPSIYVFIFGSIALITGGRPLPC